MAELGMGLDGVTIFRAFKERLKWVGQRQVTLAQNVANADTPQYRPKDLREMDFDALLREYDRKVHVKQTNPNHLQGTGAREVFRSEVDQTPYETAPDGNAVLLEEQVMKLGQNAFNHKVSTDLYHKHLSMIKTALGKK